MSQKTYLTKGQVKLLLRRRCYARLKDKQRRMYRVRLKC